MSSPQAPGPGASRRVGPAHAVDAVQQASYAGAAADGPDSRRAGARDDDTAPTTVLPGGGSVAGATAPSTSAPGASGQAGPSGLSGRPAPQRPSAREPRDPAAPRPGTKNRKARLAVQRIDPWSVFLYSLVSSIFLGIALVVAIFALYAVLDRLGVPDTVNQLFLELTGGDAASAPLLSSGRFVGGATVLAAVNVVLITLLSTLGALLYNLCASFTGGVEVTLGERD